MYVCNIVVTIICSKVDKEKGGKAPQKLDQPILSPMNLCALIVTLVVESSKFLTNESITRAKEQSFDDGVL